MGSQMTTLPMNSLIDDLLASFEAANQAPQLGLSPVLHEVEAFESFVCELNKCCIVWHRELYHQSLSRALAQWHTTLALCPKHGADLSCVYLNYAPLWKITHTALSQSLRNYWIVRYQSQSMEQWKAKHWCVLDFATQLRVIHLLIASLEHADRLPLAELPTYVLTPKICELLSLRLKQ